MLSYSAQTQGLAQCYVNQQLDHPINSSQVLAGDTFHLQSLQESRNICRPSVAKQDILHVNDTGVQNGLYWIEVPESVPTLTSSFPRLLAMFVLGTPARLRTYWQFLQTPLHPNSIARLPQCHSDFMCKMSMSHSSLLLLVAEGLGTRVLFI